MYKLINSKGTIHDFAHKMYWGHNIEGSDRPEIVEFAELKTQKFEWSVFHWASIKKGDFIIRNMNSGKIGIYECVNVRFPSFSVSNHDLYEVTAVFCGYFDREENSMGFFNGYGIPKPNPFQEVFSKLKFGDK